MSYVSELEDRIAALESHQLTVKDLPLPALQLRLEEAWLPDALAALRTNQLSPERLGILRGLVSTTAPTVLGGHGFTAVNIAVGRVGITYDTAFADTPAVVATPFLTAHEAVLGAGTEGTQEVKLFTAAGVAVDASFAFVAIGAR